MVHYERKRFGLTIYFTKEETEDLADSASAVAIVAAAIPDSTVSKVVAASAGIIALLAQRAKRKGQGLGLSWIGLGVAPIPFFFDEPPKAARAL
ncbi:hypothetical protein [Streptomyces sp. NPDC050564]|uniref:hypothetical protein n=1 Tax=Streptomyces sp. NPDC050564 TaxID=3365631 RepID=UPI0037B825D9